jgi:ABC-type Fe3+ transport system permease subunit
MSTHWKLRTARTTLVTILLLLGTAAPALAGPYPLDKGSTGTSPSPGPSSTDLSTWAGIAFGAAGTLAIVLVAFALTVLIRRAHREAPHPA